MVEGLEGWGFARCWPGAGFKVQLLNLPKLPFDFGVGQQTVNIIFFEHKLDIKQQAHEVQARV